MENRIRELREARGWSLDDLAREIKRATGYETGRQQISKLELGKLRLKTDWMDRIAKAMGVEPWQLLPGAPDFSPRELRVMRALRNKPADYREWIEAGVLGPDTDIP